MKLMKIIGKSIDIIGDSFSCPCCKFDSSDTYLELLEGEYEFKIKNYSLHGTGAHWCIEKFMSINEHHDFLLFCLPDMNRLWLDYLPEHEASTSSMIYRIMDDRSYDFPDTFDDDIVDQSERIFKDYESFYTSGLHRILEVLYTSFIFSKSKKYKKILIWPSSGLGYPFRHYNYTLEIPDNVYIVPRCLNLISHLEKKTQKVDSVRIFGNDKRNNHLSEYNHVILARQIFDFFVKDKLPVISEFKYSFI